MTAVPRDVLALVMTDADLRVAPKPEIVNVVATYDNANPLIHMELLTMRFPGIAYNPQKFAAAKMRQTRAMALAFSSGRIVCPGARSVAEARLAGLRFTEMHIRAGEYVQFRHFTVVNIVMSVWLPWEVELADVVAHWAPHATYTDSFPGISFRVPAGGGEIVFNVFVTGRIVITNSRNERDSHRAWYWFYANVLVRHKRGTAAGTTNSSAYRAAQNRARDTLTADCASIASRHTRRRDGPMASSVRYGAFVGQTPRTASHHAPTTLRIAALAATAAAGSTTFPGHDIATCAWLAPDAGRDTWYREYLALDDAAVHNRGRCRTRDARVLRTQLIAAIGEDRLACIHGDTAPLRGHALTCPFVAMCTPAAWTGARMQLEIALAAAVNGGAHDEMNAALSAHRDAGCAMNGDDDDIACAHMYIAQLHAAGLDGGMAPLSADDIIDHAMQYRLEALRASSDGDSTAPRFSLDGVGL